MSKKAYGIAIFITHENIHSLRILSPLISNPETPTTLADNGMSVFVYPYNSEMPCEILTVDEFYKKYQWRYSDSPDPRIMSEIRLRKK